MNVQQCFTFQLVDTWLAIEPSAVETILDPQHYVELPLTPHHILGIIPHGQSIIPILHLPRFLKMIKQDTLDAKHNRILIVKVRDMDVGIPIETTGGVEIIPTENITQSTLTKNGRLQDFLTGEYEGDHGLTGILDIALILERSRV